MIFCVNFHIQGIKRNSYKNIKKEQLKISCIFKIKKRFPDGPPVKINNPEKVIDTIVAFLKNIPLKKK